MADRASLLLSLLAQVGQLYVIAFAEEAAIGIDGGIVDDAFGVLGQLAQTLSGELLVLGIVRITQTTSALSGGMVLTA
jgi:hypothetical protein